VKVIYAEQAREDLQGIRRRSREQWGAEHSARYQQLLKTRIRQLRFFPYLGQTLPHFGGARQLVINHHLAIYRVEGNQVLVLRIVHGRMNLMVDNLESLSIELEGE
jgi:toxin ParE1/3/4